MSLIKRFFTVSGLTIVSRLFGVIREAALSHFLGACIEMDAFLIAFKFPSFFRKCFTEGGFHSIFIPYFIDFSSKNKKQGAFLFSSKIFTLLFVVMFFFSIVVIIFADTFVSIMAPGFISSPEKFNLAVTFTRIIFPSIGFLALSTVYSGILISYNHFFSYAFVPIIVNIILIFSLFVGVDLISPGYRISYGVLIASVVQLIFLYLVIKRFKIKMPVFSQIRISKKTREFLKKLVPVIIGAGVVQFNVFVGTFFGSFLQTGSISFIYFADRFIQLPLAIFGITISTVLLPEISKIYSKRDNTKIENIREIIATFSLRMAIPAAVGLIAISYPIIDFLYGHGKFTDENVYQTSTVLQIFSIGLPAYVMSKILGSVLFAGKDSKTPLYASMVSIICNILLTCLLIKRLGVYGVAISTSVAGFVNVFMIYKKTKNWFIFDKKMLLCLLKVVVSSIIMYAIVVFFSRFSIIMAVIVGCFIYSLFMIVLRDSATVKALEKAKYRL